MELRRFRAGVRRGRTATHALIAVTLAAVLAVLAVTAQAGTSVSGFASVQRAAVVPLGARALGAPAADAGQSGYVVLKPRDEQALKSFIASVTKLHSKDYHHYLQAGQFAGRFGPSSSTIAAVKSQLSRDGLSVTGVSRDGLLVGFRGTTSQVESAFHTGLERYRSAAGITGEQTTRAVSLPSSISSDVSAVIGLNTLVHPHSNLIRPPRSAYAGYPAAKTATFPHYAGAPSACAAATGTASLYGGLTDDQIANAYGATPLYGAGDTGAGVNIGVYELEPFSGNDLKAFDECYFGTTQGDAMATSVSTVSVDGGQPAGSGSGESILDIEDVSAMAPGAHIDVYQAPNSSAGALDEYAQMVNDDKDQIITSSWGLCEQDLQLADPGAQQAENYIFQQAAAQGQTVLAAAGDTGNDSCNEVRSVPPPTDQNPLSVLDPASQPYVLAVGGTTLQDANPANYDETVWNDGAQWGGGGGGISESWMAPSWQLGAPVGTGQFPGLPTSSTFSSASTFETNQTISSQGATPGFCTSASGYVSGSACRTLPDVSAQADEFTGAVTIYDGSYGGWLTIGGTSSATPIWAGMLALVDGSSYCSADTVTFADGAHPDIGFANPMLYAVASAGGVESNGLSQYADSFHDITSGNNDVFGFDNGALFPTATGYDLASGLGSPVLAHADGTPGLAENLCGLATADGITPVVSTISPNSGPLAGGTAVTVTGSGFQAAGGVSNVASVTVGSDVITPTSSGAAGSFTVTSSTTLSITTPAGPSGLAPAGGSEAPQDGAGPANIIVTLKSGGSSNATPRTVFNYVDGTSGNTPSVSSVSPNSGLQVGGSTVTVYGSGFAANSTVTIGGVAASPMTYVSSSELKVVVPAFADGTTACTTNTQLANELANLGNTTDTNPAVDNICQTQVVVTDPNTATHSAAPALPLAYFGPLPTPDQDGIPQVPAGYELSAAPDEYDYVPVPTITNVSTQSTNPAAYADGSSATTPIEITGTGLSYQTLNWLYFGGTTNSSSQDINYPVYDDGTHIEIVAPVDPTIYGSSGSPSDSVSVTADTTTGALSRVDTSCLDVSSDCVTYAGIPAITAVHTSPVDGAAPDSGGNSVTIDGVGLTDVVGPIAFVDAYSPFSVGTQYQYTHGGDTQISTETVQQNPGIIDTVVCSNSGCGSTAGTGSEFLLYPPGNPVITSIQTSSGPPAGGTLVTINGENLGCTTGVSFGSNQVVSLSNTQAILDCGSTSQLTVVSPAGTAGSTVPITLDTVESLVTGAPSATSPTGFTYDSANPAVSGSTSFGSVDLGSTGSETVTVTNPSSATQPLHPGGYSGSFPAFLAGADPGEFTITNDACSGATVNPGSSCSIQVQFRPTALGSRTATLDIPWNDSAGADGTTIPDLTASLSGNGAEPTNTVTVTNTVTTPGTTTTVTVVKKVTCVLTVHWRWVTVKVHGHKRRKHKKFVHRSAGCKLLAEKAAAIHRRALLHLY